MSSTGSRSGRTVRRLTPDDFAQTLTLGQEAFGDLPAGVSAPTPERTFAEGRHQWGTFDGDRLLAKVVGLQRASWWGGRELPTCGVAGVAVTAEHRGDGLLAGLFSALLTEATARGDVLSTLYPTAPGIYRGSGYELVTSYDLVELHAVDLAAVRRPTDVTTRRAVVADMPVVRALYDTWAAAQNGPLTRRGLTFTATDQERLDAVTAVTLAIDSADTVVGFAAWNRGTGYDDTAIIEVDDLVALTADGYRALWRVLGSFASVVPRIRLWTSGDDPARLVLPAARWTPVERHPYMLRILDVTGALAVLPAAGRSEVVFDVAGDRVGDTDGGYRVRSGADGTVVDRVPAGPARPTFTPNGLALLWSGVQNAENLRLTGHLRGPVDNDARLDDLALHRPRHVRDYF